MPEKSEYVKQLEQMVWNYIQVMEDYDAGCPLTDENHPHHEDWIAARTLLGVPLKADRGRFR